MLFWWFCVDGLGGLVRRLVWSCVKDNEDLKWNCGSGDGGVEKGEDKGRKGKDSKINCFFI